MTSLVIFLDGATAELSHSWPEQKEVGYVLKSDNSMITKEKTGDKRFFDE
jgi:hypothetical protein